VLAGVSAIDAPALLYLDLAIPELLACKAMSSPPAPINAVPLTGMGRRRGQMVKILRTRLSPVATCRSRDAGDPQPSPSASTRLINPRNPDPLRESAPPIPSPAMESTSSRRQLRRLPRSSAFPATTFGATARTVLSDCYRATGRTLSPGRRSPNGGGSPTRQVPSCKLRPATRARCRARRATGSC
jgi:hypothetical protein